MDTLTQLQSIFNDIQSCDSRQFGENMRAALDIIPRDCSFLRIIDTILLCQRSSPPPKVVHFLKRVLEELRETSREVFRSVLEYLVDKSSCKSTRVRRNALRLLSTVLSIEEDGVDGDVLSKVAEKLFDREQGVRKEALRMCISFQNQQLCGTLRVHAAIKDLIRYDPSHEIRKIGFLGLELNESTYNCILERCIDSNASIRRAFWTQYFPRIDMSGLTHIQRIYLMKKGISEREFNAKEIFLESIRAYGMEKFIDDFYCEDEEYVTCIEECLKRSTENYELDRYTPSYLHFLTCYYKITEERSGKDALRLPPLEEFLKIFYLKCVELEKALAEQPDLRVLKYFLRILGFYDLFTDDSKKYVVSIVNHLVLTCNFTSVVEEAVMLLARTCEANLEKITGSLIKKTRGSPICFALCEAVMKHLPLGAIHEAILSEITILDIEQSSEIYFWYFTKNPNPNIELQYLSLLPRTKVVEGCADLVLMGILDVSKLEPCLQLQLSRFNQHCAVPVCKLLLGGKLASGDYVKYLLLTYYSTETDSIQQYLSLFFFEYFRNTPCALADAFCDVLSLISANHKIFIDQSLFWMSAANRSLEYQRLYLAVCTFIYNKYDDLPNRKYFFVTLGAISVDPSWEPVTTKAIITVLGLIIRKRPRENVNVLLNQVMEVDDGTPLSTEEFEKLKRTLEG